MLWPNKNTPEETMRLHDKTLGLALSLAALTVTPQMAQAQSIAEFYRENAINLIIGFPVGGGYDIYGRLVSRHMGKHIPGNPKMVPQNMIGAGGMKAANFMYGVAPKDGTTLGIIPDTSPSEELLGTNGVAYVSKNFNWIGRISASTNVQVLWATSGVKNIADARAKGAEIFTNGRWVEVGFLPVGEPVITKRKYVEVLAAAKHEAVNTRHDTAEAERPRNFVERTLSSRAPFSVIKDDVTRRWRLWYNVPRAAGN